jgi:uncharacterized protein YndB with AHSA1/START domain
MKTNLAMNFTIDRENKKIVVEKEFAAPVEKVWAAWTQREILDKWWAPEPWKAVTKEMDFSEGGYWLYAMVGPGGETHWSRADYISITPLKEFSGIDGFCDENGKINNELPISNWRNIFISTSSNSTIVSLEITYDEVEDLDKYIEMGFREGLTSALENLDNLLIRE